MRKIGKALPALLLVLLLCCLTPKTARAADTEETFPTTTVMVYLCGSDLESRFGSASRDLTEMMASGFDPAYTNVVVMLGGSKSWKLGFDARRTSIAEVHGQGLRTVWRSEEPLNMAEAKTLQTFLGYAYEHYPADRYGLILWNHGGGPNEGLCSDENFDGQSLTLSGLREALGNSMASQRDGKLGWIGFDACLMANVETAYMLRDYASYMVASQAQEPSTGWNYAFLKGLERDEDAAATARRIIDAYMEGNGEDSFTLTLSCVDLGRVWEVRNAMDRFFSGLYPVLSDETYSELSRWRHQTRGFGRAEYNEAADYDLVDLLGLTEAYEREGIPGEALKEAIAHAVVYSRSNTEGVNGLSVYHPCYNRRVYTSEWSERYGNAFGPMSRHYLSFIRRFGRILTGEQLGHWSGLETQRRTEPTGEVSFSVTLTDEQAANFEHATLMIVKQLYTINQGLLNDCYEVWETPYLELDENNTLTAVYPKKAVYVVDETGKQLAGPVDYRITREGKLQICVLYYDEDGILDEDLLNTMLYCNFPKDSNVLTVESICAYDEAAGGYSARMSIDEEYIRQQDYAYAVFYTMEHVLPAKGDELPGFREWPDDDGFVYSEINLPCRWHFEIMEDTEIPETTFATFQITDTQNVVHSSSLSRVYPELVEDYTFLPAATAGETPLRLEATAERYRDHDSVSVRIDVLDAPSQIYVYSGDKILLNDTVTVESKYLFSTDGTLMLTLTHEELFGLSEIRSLSFVLTTKLSDYSQYSEDVVRLELAEPIRLDNGDAVPLASVSSEDGLEWDIWEIKRADTGSLQFWLTLTNPTSERMDISLTDLVMEGYVGSPYLGSAKLDPGQKTALMMSVSPRVSDFDESFRVITTMREPLAHRGIHSLGSFRLLYQDRTEYPYIPHEVGFRLAEPFPYEPLLEVTPLLGRELARTEELCVSLEQFTFYREEKYEMDALSLGLWLVNDSEQQHHYRFGDFTVDEVPSENKTWWESMDFDVPARSAEYDYLQIELPAGAEQSRTVSFSLLIDDVFLQRITLTLDEFR